MAWPGIGPLLSVNEFAIHHEDVRRAQPGWQPRSLSREEQDLIWSASSVHARRTGRRGVVLRRTDVSGQYS